MSEVATDAKVVLINYLCDNCNKGIVQCIDSRCEKDDNGDFQMIYTHKCPVCGLVADLENIRYPYAKIIPLDKNQFRNLTDDEKL